MGNIFFQKTIPFIGFGILLAGLYIAFRHQIGGPINAKSSVAFIGAAGNPYALKEAYIKRYLIYPGVTFSVVGGIIAIVSAFTTRSRPIGMEWGYIPLAVIIPLLVIAWAVQKTTMFAARRSYYPKLVAHQSEPYKVNRYLIQTGGLYERDNTTISIGDDVKSERLEIAWRTINDVCDILEVEPCNNSKETIKRLDEIFDKYK